MRQFSMAICICLTTALAFLAANDDANATDPRPAAVPPSGIGLGWGWQSDREAAIPSRCVEFARGEDLAQTTRLTMREVSDRSELMEELGISASAAVDAITFSASASASFAKSVDLKQTSSTFLLRAEIDDGLIFTAPPAAGGPLRAAPRPVAVAPAQTSTPPAAEPGRIWNWLRGFGGRAASVQDEDEDEGEAKAERQMDQDPAPPIEAVRLTPRAHALAAAGELDAFSRECGDSFVWGIRGGAELNAAITFQSRSLKEKTELASEISGSYSFVRGTGKFNADHDASETAESYTLTSIQIGGSEGAIPSSREKLLAKLDGLAGEAAKRPKPVGILIASYHDLPGWPAGPLAVEPSEQDMRLASYWSYSTLYENIEDVLANPGSYMLNRGATLDSLRALQDQVNAIRESIERAAQEIDSFERQEGLSAKNGVAVELEALLRDMVDGDGDGGETAVPPVGATVIAEPAIRMTEAVAKADSDMVPVEELLTRMPLPYADPRVRAEDRLSDAEMQRAIVDYHIARTAKRRCALAASAPGCLSNREIEGFVLQVPTGPKDLTRHGDPIGYGTGRRFGDVPLYSVLDSRLDSVALYFSKFGITGLDLTYKTPDGRRVTIGSGQLKGTDKKSLGLEDGERLSRVDGLWLPITSDAFDGRHIVELNFTTSQGRKLGHRSEFAAKADIRKASTPFAFAAADGEEVFALAGRLHDVRIGVRGGLAFAGLGVLEPVYRKVQD